MTESAHELIRIETTPPSIVANFDEVEARLRQYLKQYDVVVTADSVADARKLRTELRAQVKELDERIKDALADASAPIREADERRKQLVQLGRDVDAKIKAQVDRFDDETRKEAENQLEQVRANLWDQHEIDPEFRRATYTDLVKVSAITKEKRKLTKTTADELERRVLADKALQDRTERRLADLSRASYESGLHAPITRDQVEHFLFEEDDAYKGKLQHLLDLEVGRQAKTEQRAREQQEREAQQRAEAEQKEADRRQRLADAPDPVPDKREQMHQHHEQAVAGMQEQFRGRKESTPEPAQASPGVTEPSPAPPPAAPASGVDQATWLVVMTFEITVPRHVTIEALKQEARRIVDERAVKNLRNVTAQRKGTT